MTAPAAPAPTPAPEEPREDAQPRGEQRPPQQEELLCTICGMRSCWRE